MIDLIFWNANTAIYYMNGYSFSFFCDSQRNLPTRWTKLEGIGQEIDYDLLGLFSVNPHLQGPVLESTHIRKTVAVAWGGSLQRCEDPDFSNGALIRVIAQKMILCLVPDPSFNIPVEQFIVIVVLIDNPGISCMEVIVYQPQILRFYPESFIYIINDLIYRV